MTIQAVTCPTCGTRRGNLPWCTTCATRDPSNSVTPAVTPDGLLQKEYETLVSITDSGQYPDGSPVNLDDLENMLDRMTEIEGTLGYKDSGGHWTKEANLAYAIGLFQPSPEETDILRNFLDNFTIPEAE